MTAAPPTAHAVTQYASEVVAGGIVAGPWVRLACERHLADLERSGGADFPYVFSDEAADKALRFFRFARLYEGATAGQPFELLPFQRFIVGSIFGWVHRDTGFRRFTTAYVETAKGSGKSPLAGVIGLYMLMADGEEGAQVYYAASKFDQALLAFRYGHTFAENSPTLSKRLIIDKQNLAFPRTNSFMRPIASRVRGQSGPLPHCVIADEIHEMDDPEVLNLLRRGVKSRQQPLIFEITNAGQGQEGIAWEHHEYSLKVLRGVAEDDHWFGYLCALDEGDDWTDPAVWEKANPGLGTILPVDYVAKQVREGREILTAQNNVKRLNLCIWTAAKTAWLDMERFDRGRVLPDEFARLVEREGRRAYMGVDLSSTVAMTAVATGWRLPSVEAAPAADSGDEEARDELARMAVRVQFFLPEDGLREREERDSVPYTAWADDGHIVLTPGNVVDYAFVRKYVRDRAAADQVAAIGFDPWNARDTLTTLQGQGLPVVEVPQSYAMLSDPCKQLERMVAGGYLLWEDNPVLRWHAMNTTVRRDPNGNILPDRSGERTRIDGISAMVTMLALLVRDPAPVDPDFEITFIDFD